MKAKMIVLPKEGQLVKNGGMFGPIETPHMTDVEEIGLMLFYKEEVFEVLNDGSKVKLTTENYNKDNTQGNTQLPDEEATEQDPNVVQPGVSEQEEPEPVQEMLKATPVQKNVKRK